MILVAGSTGLLGSAICQVLSTRGLPFRALVRANSDPGKVTHLTSLGAQLIRGDLRDPASIKAACQGVDTVIETISAIPSCYSPGQNDIQSVDLEGSMALVNAAKAAGVKHFIYTSFSGNLNLDVPLVHAKRTVENYLKASGMMYTILRPSAFMEVWLGPAVGFDAANGKITVYGSGDQPMSWIALADVVAFAVESLSNPAARNAVLELGGPAPVSPHRAIAIFEKEAGRTFDVTHVPVEALLAQLAAATDPMQKSFTGLMVALTVGDAIDMSATLQTFPLKLTTVEEFAKRVMIKA